MTAAGDGYDPEGEDRGVGRRVQEAYATRVGIDTAARHLWSMDRESRRLRCRRRRQRLVSAAASLVVLVAAAGTVAGSAMALPGETLYPVKESLERAELTIAVSDAANARAHLRHSRVRLEELEAAAESNPEVVPEIAERFYTSLERAAALGGESVAGEVAALRTSASLLMDRIGRNLDPSIAESLTVARTTRNDTASSERGRQALGGARSGDGADDAHADAGGGTGSDGGDGSADGAPEPMAPEPETTVAEAGRDEDEPSELVEETATAELPAETVVADPEETATGEPETSSGEADGEDAEAGEQDGAGDDGEQDGTGDDPEQDGTGDDAERDGADGEQPDDGPSLEGRTAESSTAESGSTSEASTSGDPADGDPAGGDSDGGASDG